MFKYEVWMDGQCLTESDYDYETDQEAMEDGIETARGKIDLWKLDNAWSGETVEDFDIRVTEE
jgi:hypothetical protein